jgi:CRISPR system CASCADE complex protein casB
VTAETLDVTPTDESENAGWNGPLRSADDVKKRVRSVIKLRQEKDSAAVAARAHMRSAAGREVGDVPAIWSYTLDSGSEKELGQKPTRGERAVHTALTLWALHQGSNDAPMNSTWKHERTIGASVRRLAYSDMGGRERAEEHPVYKRLCAMIAAPTFESLTVHARGLVSMLGSAEISMDYGRFAADLYNWQKPERRAGVLRQWGRDFARTPADEEQTGSSTTTSIPEPN